MYMTKYIIEMSFEQKSIDQIEKLWSTLMNANVDCVTDLKNLGGSRTQYRRFSIYFKTIEERDYVNTILKLAE